MLKEKIDFRYRKSSIAAEGSRMRRCKFCGNKRVIEIHDEQGAPLGYGQRCTVLGLRNERRYAIEDGYVCNGFKVKNKKED